MKNSDVHLFELNEAFASVVLRLQVFKIDSDNNKINGGAIVLGHSSEPQARWSSMPRSTSLSVATRPSSGYAVNRQRHWSSDHQ